MPKPAKAKGGKAAKAAPAKKKAVKKAAPKVVRKSAKELRIERFVAEYLVDYNGRRAAIAAGFSPATARSIASQLLAQADVQALIQARQAKLCDQLEDMERFVLKQLMGVATADPRELSEHYRVSCRYCYGKKHRYQRRQHERDEAYAEWLKEEAKRQKQDPPLEPTKFDELGGVGYSTKNEPNPDCPACDGEGISHAVFKDTRDFSPQAALLYQGIEITQNGMKMRAHSGIDAAKDIGKHFGMFAQKVKVGADKDGKEAEKLGVLGDILDLVNASDTGTGPARSRRSG